FGLGSRLWLWLGNRLWRYRWRSGPNDVALAAGDKSGGKTNHAAEDKSVPLHSGTPLDNVVGMPCPRKYGLKAAGKWKFDAKCRATVHCRVEFDLAVMELYYFIRACQSNAAAAGSRCKK